MHCKSKIACCFLLFFCYAQSFALSAQRSSGVMIAKQGEERSVFRALCDPRSNLQNDVSPPISMIRQLYNVDIKQCITALKESEIKCAHCSMCAITYVYKMDTANKWLVETTLFESLFVSGAYGIKANGVYVLLSKDLKLKVANMSINTVFAFPSINQQSASHSERTVVSFLINSITCIPRQTQTPHFVAIHIKNLKPSCMFCYNAIANARASLDGDVFKSGNGLIDVFSRPNLAGYPGGVSVIVGIGHCQAKQNEVNIDWIDRF